MRNVLSSGSEVAHYWANKAQDYGRNSGDSMFFSGDKIFSYGRHFCMGRHLPNRTVALTSRRYSNTTAKHQGHVRNAVRTREIVYCNDPGDSARANMVHARDTVGALLASVDAPRIRQTTKDARKAEALRIALEANRYLAALDPSESMGEAPIDTENLDGVLALLIATEKARVEAQEAHRKAQAAEQVENLARWRTGALALSNRLYSLPAALRLSGDSIETSHGAVIPVSDALKLWPLVLRVMRGENDYTPGEPLGVYRLTKIRRDGSIVVGCHDIAHVELVNMAHALNLIAEPLAA